MTRALKAEFLKLKGSRTLLWAAIVVIAYAILATVLNALLLKDPAITARIASAGGSFRQAVDSGFYQVDWPNQLRVAVQGISGTWGILLFSFVATYVFGREYKDGTAKNMLTLPVRREYFIAAKMVVVATWIFCLMLLSLGLHAIGLVIVGVPGFAWRHVWGALWDGITVTFAIYLTLPLVAWITMTGRGYLRGMLFALAAVMVGNGLAATSLSRYYPWNLPVHLVGASWMPIVSVHPVLGSWIVSACVFLAGLVLATRQTDAADDVS
jgi:ABC-2 type transport system permease protein